MLYGVTIRSTEGGIVQGEGDMNTDNEDTTLQLGEDEYQTIHHLLVSLNQEGDLDADYVEYLLHRWLLLVTEVEQGYSFIVPEYQNNLDARQLLYEMTYRLPDHLTTKFDKIVYPLDERFKEATQEVHRSFCTTTDEELGWWCFRMPKKFREGSDSIDRWLKPLC